MFQRIADGVFAIAGAAGFSQFPEFFRQYVQRLGGRFDQAAVQQERIVAAARDHGTKITAISAYLVLSFPRKRESTLGFSGPVA